MIFGWEKHETPLTRAVLEDDYKMLEELGKYKDQVLAPNELGFSALDLAHHLGKKKCLNYIELCPSHTIKVLPPNEKEIREMNEKEFEEFFELKYQPYLTFADYPFFQKVLRKCSWILKGALLGEEIQERGEKYQKEVQCGYFADVTIQWIDDKMGYGVFTNKDLNSGDYIGEYVGVVHRFYRFESKHNAYCLRYPQMVWALNVFFIDSLHQGNESRFINHSFTPNLDILFSQDRGLMHVLFFANKNIPKKNQLTFNYGKHFWRNREEPEEI